MRNKVKAKVLNNFYRVGKELEYKRIVLEFDKYIHSKEIYNELLSMKCTQYSVVDIIREVWEEIKSIN